MATEHKVRSKILKTLEQQRDSANLRTCIIARNYDPIATESYFHGWYTETVDAMIAVGAIIENRHTGKCKMINVEEIIFTEFRDQY